ncbi:MAG: hypothetical protein OXI81_16950 [Paracoccaceae bacterium]|nr:hypothetical protein [Paracoccaceae bacterium]
MRDGNVQALLRGNQRDASSGNVTFGIFNLFVALHIAVFGGRTVREIYENMTTALSKVLVRRGRAINGCFEQMCVPTI